MYVFDVLSNGYYRYLSGRSKQFKTLVVIINLKKIDGFKFKHSALPSQSFWMTTCDARGCLMEVFLAILLNSHKHSPNKPKNYYRVCRVYYPFSRLIWCWFKIECNRARILFSIIILVRNRGQTKSKSPGWGKSVDEKASRYTDICENLINLFTMFLHSYSSFLFFSLQVSTPHLKLRQGFISGMAFSSPTQGSGRNFLSCSLPMLLFPVLMQENNDPKLCHFGLHR